MHSYARRLSFVFACLPRPDLISCLRSLFLGPWVFLVWGFRSFCLGFADTQELSKRALAFNRMDIPADTRTDEDKGKPSKRQSIPVVCPVCGKMVCEEFINVVAFRNLTKEFGRVTTKQGSKVGRFPVQGKICSYACFNNKASRCPASLPHTTCIFLPHCFAPRCAFHFFAVLSMALSALPVYMYTPSTLPHHS